MGRIKTKQVKRITFELIAMHGDKFKTDYESNKAIVSQVTNVQSKKLRNTIAGYLTRLTKIQN
jgi:small subunit ribosomal protein S17e